MIFFWNNLIQLWYSGCPRQLSLSIEIGKVDFYYLQFICFYKGQIICFYKWYHTQKTGSPIAKFKPLLCQDMFTWGRSSWSLCSPLLPFHDIWANSSSPILLLRWGFCTGFPTSKGNGTNQN